MVDYIGVGDVTRLIQAIGPGAFIERLADEILADYRRWAEFEKSARLASHSPVGVIELMPTSDGKFYSFKYVNGHPKNTTEGLLTVTAFGVLADVATGYPLLLSELTVTTALRTAATSALAARLLARPESRSMALIGNGAQSEFQAIAFHRMLGITELRLYDVDRAATAKLERNLAASEELADLRVVRAASAADACRGADVVTTVTADKRNAVILTPPMVRAGMHLNAVGGDCPGKTELHPDVLRMPQARVVVEYEPQSRIEGEIQQMPPEFPVIELAAVASGRTPGRTSDRDLTIFDSVGFALEDYAALRFLYSLLGEDLITRRRIDLVPTLADPKDLFGGTLGAGTARQKLRRSA
ncbi:MAG TPA: ornithine cyclodeaminase [Steroidobacteraceae bacterium]|nr:ornithine cyclodeaminase [Steroidobacteraceae bacterium]